MIAAFGFTLVPGAMDANMAMRVRTVDSLVYSYRIGTSGTTLTVYCRSDMVYIGYIRNDEPVKPIWFVQHAMFGAPTASDDLPARLTTCRTTVAVIGIALGRGS